MIKGLPGADGEPGLDGLMGIIGRRGSPGVKGQVGDVGPLGRPLIVHENDLRNAVFSILDDLAPKMRRK